MNPISSSTYSNQTKIRVKKLEKVLMGHPNHRGIKKDLFFFSTLNFYSDLPLSLMGRHLTVMGLVHDDGVGDYYHVLHVAEFVKNQFPDLGVSMVLSHVDPRLPSLVKMPHHPDIKTIFCEVDQDHSAAYPLLERADFILEMSQMIDDPRVEAIVKGKLEKYRFIGEYGIQDKHSMGFRLNNLGIIIKKSPLATSLLDLVHPGLKNALFCTKNPSSEDLEKYRDTHVPFVAYLKMGSYYQMGLIYTIAAYSKVYKQQIIDLIIPSVKMDYLDYEFLKAQGIAKIKVIDVKEGETYEREMVLGVQGKTLRLIHPFPLEQKDFHILVTCTNPLVGCTGDHSLSEIISFDRVPFYELRSLKVGLMQDTIKLCHSIGKKHLMQYFQVLSSIFDEEQEEAIKCVKNGEGLVENVSMHRHLHGKQQQLTTCALTLSELLQKPEFHDEIHQFNHFVQSNHSFDPMLKSIVEKQLAFMSYPNLKSAEEGIQESYLKDAISLDQAQLQLAELLGKTDAVDSLNLVDSRNAAPDILQISRG